MVLGIEAPHLADLLRGLFLDPFDLRQHSLAARECRLVDGQLQPLGRPLQLQLVDAGSEGQRVAYPVFVSIMRTTLPPCLTTTSTSSLSVVMISSPLSVWMR